MTNIALNFRSRTPEDRNFIFSSWMKSFRAGSKWAQDITSGVYSTRHAQLIDRLLSESGSVIACSPDEPNQIFGFAIYQPSAQGIAIMHWLYIKEMYRKFGIGQAIFREVLDQARHNLQMPIAITHSTQNIDWAMDKYNLVYNPYLAFEVTHDEDISDRLCERH